MKPGQLVTYKGATVNHCVARTTPDAVETACGMQIVKPIDGMEEWPRRKPCARCARVIEGGAK